MTIKDRKIMQATFNRLLINQDDYEDIADTANIIWGLLVGDTTKEEEKIITDAAEAVEKVLRIFNPKL
jgi:hypothetical protein